MILSDAGRYDMSSYNISEGQGSTSITADALFACGCLSPCIDVVVAVVMQSGRGRRIYSLEGQAIGHNSPSKPAQLTPNTKAATPD